MPKTVLGTGLNPEQDEAKSATALLRLDLRVCTLGPPNVKCAGCALDIPRRHVWAVLYRLVMWLTPLLGEHLCGLFWSDIPECTARRNLSHVLTHLHGLFPAPEVLLCTDDSIALDPQQT